MKHRTLGARIGLLVGAIFVSIVIAELAVRVSYDPRPREREEQRRVFPTYFQLVEAGLFTRDLSGDLCYRLTPGFEMDLDGNTYAVNNNGIRGSANGESTVPNARRVLLLGDSYAFGLGVDQKDTLGEQLRARLMEHHHSVSVFNLGVPGYHTGQELAIAERIGFDYDPDLVVLLFCANDETTQGFQYDPSFRVLYGDALPIPYSLKSLLVHSAVYRWVARMRVGQMRARGDFASFGDMHWPITKHRLAAMFCACSDRGVPLLFVNLPTLWSSKALITPDWVGHKNYDRIADFVESQDIPQVDLRAALLATSGSAGDQFLERLLISVDPPIDHHLNASGYAVVAETIVDSIVAEELLGPTSPDPR